MIRPATEADTPRLVEMTTRFLETTPYGTMFQADPAQIAKLVALVLKHGVILLADVPPVVGMIALAALPHPLSGLLYADEQCWWVEPEHRKGTIGPRLLMAAEAWARQHGCQSVKMVAQAGSSVGCHYLRLGYQEVETAFVKKLA